jgi:hypothetical protein
VILIEKDGGVCVFSRLYSANQRGSGIRHGDPGIRDLVLNHVVHALDVAEDC